MFLLKIPRYSIKHATEINIITSVIMAHIYYTRPMHTQSKLTINNLFHVFLINVNTLDLRITFFFLFLERMFSTQICELSFE